MLYGFWFMSNISIQGILFEKSGSLFSLENLSLAFLFSLKSKVLLMKVKLVQSLFDCLSSFSILWSALGANLHGQ